VGDHYRNRNLSLENRMTTMLSVAQAVVDIDQNRLSIELPTTLAYVSGQTVDKILLDISVVPLALDEKTSKFRSEVDRL
jgi:hypothetical protein